MIRTAPPPGRPFRVGERRRVTGRRVVLFRGGSQPQQGQGDRDGEGNDDGGDFESAGVAGGEGLGQWSTITPPSSSPMAPPTPAIAPQTASARLRPGPSAKVVRMIDSAAGETIAPPSPCNPRATSSIP